MTKKDGNARQLTKRVKAYRDLLALAAKFRGYALEAIDCLQRFAGVDPDQTIAAKILAEELEKVLFLFQKVMDQTERRVMQGEKVPASEKVVSLFECHADIIVKSGRDTQNGHKVFNVPFPDGD